MRRHLLFLLLALPASVSASDCARQLQLLGEDLKEASLTQARKQEIGGIIDDARRHCWAHFEEAAMRYIARARQAAGIGPPREEFDWETVPLESLEER